MAESRLIFVISDATGETAEKVVRAALLQFTAVPAQLRRPLRGPLPHQRQQQGHRSGRS